MRLRSRCARSSASARFSIAGERGGQLDRHAEFLDDAADGLVDLDLELTLLDAQVAHRFGELGELRLGGADGVLRVVDGRAQRLGVRLLEAGAVAELDRPVLGPLVQHRVEVVDRLDALAQQFERDLGLPRPHGGVLELGELGVDGGHLALQVHLALGDRGDLDLARAQPLGDGGLLAEAGVAGLAGGRRGLLERLELGHELLDRRRVGLARGQVLAGMLA